MEEILEEFGDIGAPSMYEITKMIYENKWMYIDKSSTVRKI